VKTKAEAKIKTDEIDSEILAAMLGAELLPQSHVPPKEDIGPPEVGQEEGLSL
jgi:hypothetical protein